MSANFKKLSAEQEAELLLKADRTLTQAERTLKYLILHNRMDIGYECVLTPFRAWAALGIYRVASPICDLRKAGYNIQSAEADVMNRYDEPCRVATYRLVADYGQP